MSPYPEYRPRRLRQSRAIRDLVSQTDLTPRNLVLPLFVTEGSRVRRAVASMPGVDQTSVDELVRDAEGALRLGIPAVLLFGIPGEKDEVGSSGLDPNGVIPRAVRALKRELPELVVVTDVCLCEYTSHGHCGVVRGEAVDNDATLPLLVEMSVAHAEAGADIVAPSDMMDGRVAAIRKGLDARGLEGTILLSYAVKYASAFYGPFRDAAESAPQFGDRRGYQMDPRNVDEAIREARLDIEEGADMIMVKPALPYLDIIQRVKAKTAFPLVAYQVSGEYAMLSAAAERGWLDGDRALEEALTAIRRAGADLIVTYGARRFAQNVRV